MDKKNQGSNAHIHHLGVKLGWTGMERQEKREDPLRSPLNTCTSKICGTADLEACNNSTSAIHEIKKLEKTL